MIDLTGKAAIVTGAASGIGRGISLVLSEQGAAVALADLNGPGAEAVSSELAERGGRAMAVTADVTDRRSVADMVVAVLDEFGKVDILVNDAGVIGAPGWWEREFPSDEDWDLTLAVNLRGVVNVSEAVMGHMKDRRYGKIVNIASIAARNGNAVCPGILWTPMFHRLAEKRASFNADPAFEGLEGRDFFEKLVDAWIPMKREQTPEDIGKIVAFLVSDDARNITGQAINVDGGRRMN